MTTRIVSCVLYCGGGGRGEGGKELCHWWKSGEENEFVEQEAFIDSGRVKNAEFKDKFFSRVLWLSVVLSCSRERLQIVMLRVEWFGK